MDANVNRAREGLRVCEEVARLVLEDLSLTRRCQRLRYDIKSIVQQLPPGKLTASRQARTDVGRPLLRGKISAHVGYRDLVKANAQRVQESLRVLEEFFRLKSPGLCQRCSLVRFRVYTLEQDLLKKL